MPCETSERDAVIQLAPTKWKAALKRARAIQNPHYRAQALAIVALHAPDREVAALARESLDSALQAEDPYGVVSLSCWALKTLIQRGELKEAARPLPSLITCAKSLQHGGSYAAVMERLFITVFPAGPSHWLPVVKALPAKHGDKLHWRQIRLLSEVLAETVKSHPQLHAELLASIRDDKDRREVEKKLAKSLSAR